MRGWKPYGLSCSKWGLDLRALLATFGFISPQAGPDAICSWRSGKNLSAFPSRRPAKLASLRLTLQPDSKHSQQSDAGLFSQNAFFPAQNRRNAQRLFSWLDKLQNLHSVQRHFEINATFSTESKTR